MAICCLGLILLSSGACAPKIVGKTGKVLVMPLDFEGSAAPAMKKAKQHIDATIEHIPKLNASRLTDTSVDGPANSDAALQSCKQSTQDELEECSMRSGQAVGADYVLVSAAGGIDNTFLVQMNLLDAKNARNHRRLERTLRGDIHVLETGIQRMTENLLDFKRVRKWYQSPWTWTAVGVIVASSIAIPIIVAKQDGGEDQEILPVLP